MLIAAGLTAAPALYFLGGSLRAFRNARTTVDPRAGASPSSLVTAGPNTHSRNPMYVGMAGLLI